MSGDEIIPNASSYLQLYSDTNERPSRQWQVECKDAAVTFADSKADRPWKFKASSYKFQDASGLNELDLRVKMDAGDAARAANATAASVADGKAVSADVRAQAAEAGIAANLAAEISARGVSEAALVVADTTNANASLAARNALDVAYKAADTILTAAIAAGEVRAKAAEEANTLAISNIIGTSPDNLNELTELVTAFTNMDSVQLGYINSLNADVAEMRAELDILLGLGGS